MACQAGTTGAPLTRLPQASASAKNCSISRVFMVRSRACSSSDLAVEGASGAGTSSDCEGQTRCMPLRRCTSMSSMVHPRSASNAEVPQMNLPCGTGAKCVMPFARATGSISESEFTASQASTSGANSPVSRSSTDPRTLLISTRPRSVLALTRPGKRCSPFKSTTVSAFSSI